MTKTVPFVVTNAMLLEMDGALDDGLHEPYIKIAKSEESGRCNSKGLVFDATIEDLKELYSRYDYVAFCAAAEMSYDRAFNMGQLRMARSALKRIEKAKQELSK